MRVLRPDGKASRMCWLNHLGTTVDARDGAGAPAHSTPMPEPTIAVDRRPRSLKVVCPAVPVVEAAVAGRERVLVRTG